MAPVHVSGTVSPSALIDWGLATSALAGEADSGDLSLVKFAGPGVLTAVVDGLGHGTEAAVAARAAVAVLERYPREHLVELMSRCHQALVGTRGAVMSLAYLDGVAGSLTWVGVGNVEGILLYTDRGGRSARTTLVAPGGILGSELPRLQAQVLPIMPGALLILASDGIRSGFAEDLASDAAPQQLAEEILARYGKGTDDAIVLVVRYAGGAGAGAAGGDGGGSGR